MNPSYTTIRSLTGNPALERLELDDVCARGGNVQDPDGFDHVNDELTDRQIDEMYVAEMARRDAEAAATFCGTPDDTDPTRPGGAAVPVPVEQYERTAANLTDDELVAAVSLADERPQILLLDGARRDVFLAVMTREVLRRLAA